MDDKKELPERFPCSGCAFSYTTGRGKGEYKGQQVIRKHNNRTGPGLCEGAGRPPAVPMSAEDAGRSIAQSIANGAPLSTPEDPFSAPAAVNTEAGDGSQGRGPWVYASFESECDGSGCQILKGDLIRSDGMDGWLCESCGEDDEHCTPGECTGCCGCSQMCTTNPCGQPEHESSPVLQVPTREEFAEMRARNTALAAARAADVLHLFTDTTGVEWSHPGNRDACVLPECVLARTPSAPDPFQAPAKAPEPEPTVSGQPEPERDRWGRYLLPIGKGGKMVGTTRATTFAKSTSDTFNLSQWGDRMVVRGLTLRPDLLALAHGLDVKRDRDAMNSIAEQAKEAAGNKVAANLGTALHAFTERLDAGQMQLQHAPPEYTQKLNLYRNAMEQAGLRTRPEWIERTTAVTVAGNRSGVQEDVAGTLDRICETPSSDRVIVDLKTGADLSYGWGEIAVQLALYGKGVNQRGLYDHRTKTWHAMDRPVREDFAIVVHLPADPTDGGKYPDRKPWCQLYWIDLREGWDAAALNADVRSWRKTKNLARPLQLEDLMPLTPAGQIPLPVETPAMAQAAEFIAGADQVIAQTNAAIAQADEALKNAREAQERWDKAAGYFQAATSKGALKELYDYAVACGHFDDRQINRLVKIGMDQLNLLEASPSG